MKAVPVIVKIFIRVAALILCVSICSGCASVSAKYIPHTVGVADYAEVKDGLQVSIYSMTDDIAKGKPVTFQAEIQNVSRQAFWVPKEPPMIFIWVYPNGQRDNFVQDYPNETHYSKNNAVLLEPGEKLTSQFTIKTHYFPRTGITEFRAVYNAAYNTNPALRPFWHGRATSNAYGVHVHRKGYRGRGKAIAQTAPHAVRVSS